MSPLYRDTEAGALPPLPLLKCSSTHEPAGHKGHGETQARRYEDM